MQHRRPHPTSTDIRIYAYQPWGAPCMLLVERPSLLQLPEFAHGITLPARSGNRLGNRPAGLPFLPSVPSPLPDQSFFSFRQTTALNPCLRIGF